MTDENPQENEAQLKRQKRMSYLKFLVCAALFIYVAYHLGHAVGGVIGRNVN